MLKKRFLKTKGEVEVTFELAPAGAEQVELVCDAKDWQPVVMEQRKKSGPFQVKVRFPSNGAVQFRYLVDGAAWVNDDAADAYWPNPFGGDNSVLFTQPTTA